MIDQNFYSTIAHLFSPQGNFVIAVSGGSDSMALAHFLISQSSHDFIIAHFHHNLRGKESDKECDLVKQCAKNFKVPFVFEKWKHPKKSEEHARIARYAFLRKIKEKYNADAIITGHHANDQVETVLFNLFRGTGVKGLCGMKPVHEDIIRPFLSITKDEILTYCKKHRISYSSSSDNESLFYNRNLIRHSIIPEAQKINEQYDKSILRTSEIFQDLDAYLDNQAQKWMKRAITNNSFSRAGFLKLPLCLQYSVISKILEQTQNLSKKHIDLLLAFIQDGRTGKRKRIQKTTFVHEYGKVTFYTGEKEDVSLPYTEIAVPGETIIDTYSFVIHKETTTLKVTYTFGSRRKKHTFSIPFSRQLFVRSWKPGDSFSPKGMKGSKKLQDFFVDEKIPSSQRSSIPIFLDSDNNILSVGWVRQAG